MDFDIQMRCNVINCRATLNSEVWVTTCSHIFCPLCAKQASLDADTRTSHVQRSCPACQTPLHNPDDAVPTNVNPSEDYKSVVLGGLGPTAIMECASRAIMFFHYQTGQEIRYQEMLVGQMASRYHTINSQLDGVISEANTEIANFRERLTASTKERKELERKNIELIEAYKAKSQAHQKLQKVYNNLKVRVGAVAIEDAAAMNLDQALLSGQGQGDETGNMNRMPQRPLQAHTTTSRSPFQRSNQHLAGRSMPSSVVRPSWSASNLNQRHSAVGTPLRDGMPGGIHAGQQDRIAHPGSVRQPLRGTDPNAGSESLFVGQGLPSGAKFSRQPDGGVNSLSGGRNFGNSMLSGRR